MDLFLGFVGTVLAAFGAAMLMAARFDIWGPRPYPEIALGCAATVLAGLVLASAIDLRATNGSTGGLLQVSQTGPLHP